LAAALAFTAPAMAGGSFTQGNELYGRGRYAEAAKLYERSIKEGASASLALFNMGNCYYQMNALARAVGCYRAAIVEAPSFFTAYLNLGVLYQSQEDWPSTVSTLEIADALEPDNKQVVLILAVAYRNLKAYGPAVKCLERALALDPAMYDCYFMLFDVYQELEDLDLAVSYLNRYPDTGRRAAEKYRLLAGVAEAKGEADKAAFFYRQQVELAPDNRAARYQLVEALNKSGHALLALETARDALKRFGDYGELALLGGNIAFERKFWRDAGQFYQTAYALGEARGLIGLQNVEKQTKKTEDN